VASCLVLLHPLCAKKLNEKKVDGKYFCQTEKKAGVTVSSQCALEQAGQFLRSACIALLFDAGGAAVGCGSEMGSCQPGDKEQ